MALYKYVLNLLFFIKVTFSEKKTLIFQVDFYQ